VFSVVLTGIVDNTGGLTIGNRVIRIEAFGVFSRRDRTGMRSLFLHSSFAAASLACVCSGVLASIFVKCGW